jgi:hypothetical protein
MVVIDLEQLWHVFERGFRHDIMYSNSRVEGPIERYVGEKGNVKVAAECEVRSEGARQ